MHPIAVCTLVAVLWVLQSDQLNFTEEALLEEMERIKQDKTYETRSIDVPDEPLSEEDAEEQLRAYCKLSPMNLPCLNGCQRKHQRCGKIYYNYSDTPSAHRHIIASMLNSMRSQIAGGDAATGFQAASALRAVSYDRECEFFAGCFLKSCSNRDSHVKIALDGTHLGSAGYGVISFNTTVDVQRDRFVIKALHGWHQSCHGPASWHMSFERIANVEKVHRDLQPNFANDYLHMYHENTTHIGCALYPRNLSSNLMFLRLYCVFKPAVPLGKNFQLYKTGKTAQGCPKSQPKNEKYALCGEMRELGDDKFVPFLNLNFSPSNVPNLTLLALLILILTPKLNLHHNL